MLAISSPPVSVTDDFSWRLRAPGRASLPSQSVAYSPTRTSTTPIFPSFSKLQKGTGCTTDGGRTSLAALRTRSLDILSSGRGLSSLTVRRAGSKKIARMARAHPQNATALTPRSTGALFLLFDIIPSLVDSRLSSMSIFTVDCRSCATAPSPFLKASPHCKACQVYRSKCSDSSGVYGDAVRVRECAWEKEEEIEASAPRRLSLDTGTLGEGDLSRLGRHDDHRLYRHESKSARPVRPHSASKRTE